MDDIIKLFNSFEGFSFLIKGVTKTIENETKEQRGGFLGVLLGTLCASSVGNMLVSKVAVAISLGRRVIHAGEGAIRVWQDF